jgi:hypothetical protein
MISLLSEALMIAAALILGVLAIEVISAMPRRGSWLPFLTWAGISCAALATAVGWHHVPLPVALLVLTLSALLWRQRRRLVWAARRGRLQ